MHGRLFEKVGVHCSTVQASSLPNFASRLPAPPTIPGSGCRDLDDRAYAQSARSGRAHEHALCGDDQSLVRRRRGPDAGAGPATDPAGRRHGRVSCRHEGRLRRPNGVADYDKYKEWCDDYFYLPHRKEARGIGGIFYDHHDFGDWDADFAFSQDVGRAFLKIYPELVRRNFNSPWTAEDREEQLIRRGRYVEFNLLYDRGTTFGLKTGGNVEFILSSMPPEVKWPWRRSWRAVARRISGKPQSSQPMVAGETRHGLVGDGLERRSSSGKSAASQASSASASTCPSAGPSAMPRATNRPPSAETWARSSAPAGWRVHARRGIGVRSCPRPCQHQPVAVTVGADR